MAEPFDTAIIGGGLVGISLACVLGARGLRVAVIEAVSPPAGEGPGCDDRGLALAYGSRRIFEGMDLWGTIGPEATPIHRIHVSERGRFGATRIDRDDEGVEALGYVVESRVLGRILMERLADLESVEWICPAALESVTSEGTAACVELRAGGVSRTVRARLLVAADGAHSAVRAALGIPVRRREYGQSAVLANVTPERFHGNTAYERFTEQGPLALLPLGPDRCAMVWTRRDERVAEVLALDDAGFLAAIQVCFGERLGRFLRAGVRTAQPLSLTLALEPVRPRVALLGNAAHTVHPVAGQGFNLGLRDVAVLAELVVDATARGDDPGDAPLLDAYARRRRRDQRRVALFTDALVRVFAVPLAPVAAMRTAGLVALDLCPPAKHRLARRAMGIAGRLSRLDRGLPV